MLHITVGESEEMLLRKSNPFPKDDIMSFCIILSYGNIKDIEKQEYREIPIKNRKLIPWRVNVKEKLKELEEKLKTNKDVRIWYSKLDNEDVCTMCFLIYYLSKYENINIYLSEVGRTWGGLGGYSADEIINLVDKKELLKNKNKYKELWLKLEKENSDIRIYEKENIMSHDFKYLDERILELLKQCGEINYYAFVGRCMGNSICNFCGDIFFAARIEEMIKNNLIEITKIQQEINSIGESVEVKYISVKN